MGLCLEIKDYSSDKSWLVWLEDLESFSDNVQSKYQLYLHRFLVKHKLTPTQLYETKLKELESKDRRDRRGLERLVKTWLSELNEEYAHGTVNIHYNAIRSFFESQDIPFKLKASDRPRGDHVGRRMITKPMIRRMVELVGMRQRERNLAMLFTLKDTGLRIGDISDLTVEQYKKARVYWNDDGEYFKELQPLTTKKAKITAYPIIGPESIKHIDEYLESRSDNEPWLFLGERGEKIRSDLLSHVFQRWADKLKDGTRISAHSFRKYHETMLEASGLNQNILKKLQGRTIADSTAAYSRPQDQPGLIVEQYIKHYEAIRLDDNSEIKELRRQQQSDLADMKAELAELKRQLLEEIKRA